MAQINQTVRDNYAAYDAFISNLKLGIQNPVILVAKPNNARWVHGICSILLQDGSCLANAFAVEQSINNRHHYGLKITSPEFGEAPCFRFDSFGATHRNHIDSIPLQEQQVTTPHYHRYNSEGILIAYKTVRIKDETVVAILRQSILDGMFLFCKEVNFWGLDGTPMACEENAASLPFPPQPDPLSGVSFGV